MGLIDQRLQRDQPVEILGGGLPDMLGPSVRLHLADRHCLLLAEAEPPPGVQDLWVEGRHQGVLPGQAQLPPAHRGSRIQVAHELGVGDGVGRGVDPRVSPPERLAA